jgi:mevalonate kinase
MAVRNYYTKGKLLISGAYGVLDGAIGFALPTKLGQRFCFETDRSNIIQCKAVDDKGNTWFEAEFDVKSLAPLKTSSEDVANTFSKLLIAARSLNPDFNYSFTLETTLEFNREWGLGSSSTLIAALAQFASVNAYELLDSGFKGSGYDIACATAEGPIRFQRINKEVSITPLNWRPTFADELYLVYLNQKMNSREAIIHYRKAQSSDHFLNELSRLSIAISEETSDINRFEKLLLEQENLLADRLGITAIGDQLFDDRPEGVFISLGAWGGDFALFTRKKNIPYLEDKGYSTILKLQELCIY